jgi:peptide-methionine (S)-S-oxide reductase
MPERAESAVLAGGCAWIMQQLLRHPQGVISTRVGWTGGEGDNPTEEDPQGHAEAVEVVFDPARLSYRELLEYFFQVHRADLGQHLVGSIYRSEIFIRARSNAWWPRRRLRTSTPRATGSARP